VIEIDGTLPPELAPLSWLVGLWEGTAVVHYLDGDDAIDAEVGHRVAFSHDGLPYLSYSSSTWLLDGSGRPFVSETGYWRLARDIRADEPGPALLPPTAPPGVVGVDDVEALRDEDGAFPLEVSIVRPDGVSEVYLGRVTPARIDLATDAVVRTVHAKDYSAATRLYGLVEGRLLWAWDVAALGHPLASHASGTLERVE
jgi:hypothetical protein